MSKTVKLSELTPDNLNANKGTQRGAGMLEKSLRDYGAGRSVLVDKAGRIIAGNKTIEAAGAIGLEDAVMVETDGSQVVIVKRTDLDIDSPEGRGLAIADNRVAEVGLDWDTEALEKIGEELDLGEFWFSGEVDGINTDASNSVDLTVDSVDVYSKKVKPPIYEITGKSPSIAELCDTAKTKTLIHKINEASISDSVKVFLKMAAERHRVFHYDRIAEYYAHADQETQGLMEDSALVIIDFDKAIENGFVRLSTNLAEAYTDNE